MVAPRRARDLFTEWGLTSVEMESVGRGTSEQVREREVKIRVFECSVVTLIYSPISLMRTAIGRPTCLYEAQL